MYLESLISGQLKSEHKLDNIVMKALQLQRVKFIEPIIHYGFVMRDFLTVQRLALLYDEEVSYLQHLYAF